MLCANRQGGDPELIHIYYTVIRVTVYGLQLAREQDRDPCVNHK